MNMKKIVGLLLAVCICFVQLGVSASSIWETVTTEKVNVAPGKKVYAPATDKGDILTNGELGDRLDPGYCNYTGANVTLPTGDVVKGADSAANDWYIIDLEKAYNLNEIRLYSRGDEPTTTFNWMGEFRVEVSNSILFPEADSVDVGGVGSTLDGTGITSRETPFVATLDGETAYRYIRIRKTAWTYFGWAELEAYCDMEVINPYGNARFVEVSRNKPAEVNYGSYYDGETVGNWSPDKVVDGKFSDGQGWIMDGVSDRPDAPYNLLIDLEKEIPVTKIEMFGRPNVSVESYRKNWKVYGFTEADGKPDISGEISGGVELLDITSPFPQIKDTQNPDGDDGLSEIVDNSVPFRYLVFSKTKNELGCLSEIRAYALIPEIEEVKMLDAQKAQIKFTESADKDSLEKGIVVNINGETVTPKFDFADETTVELDFGKEYFDAQIDILIDTDLLTKYGIPFEEKEFHLFTPKAVSAEAEFVSGNVKIDSLSDALATKTAGAEVVVKNNTKTEKAEVVVLTVLYNDKNFVVAANDEKVTVESGTEKTITSSLNLPSEITEENVENYKLSVFVWKDYSILKPWIKKMTLGQ